MQLEKLLLSYADQTPAIRNANCHLKVSYPKLQVTGGIAVPGHGGRPDAGLRPTDSPLPGSGHQGDLPPDMQSATSSCAIRELGTDDQHAGDQRADHQSEAPVHAGQTSVTRNATST